MIQSSSVLFGKTASDGSEVLMNEENSDPRVYFAAERTMLAWLRTGIAVMAFGFVVARFGLFLRLLRAQGGEGSISWPLALRWHCAYYCGWVCDWRRCLAILEFLSNPNSVSNSSDGKAAPRHESQLGARAHRYRAWDYLDYLVFRISVLSCAEQFCRPGVRPS